ncbi:MAG TPA: polyphosphate kinase 2 family protein [Rhodothermales bacterium]|nr:polyphosphate kinase 2 family protein [Rhodothermales bacterium]
MDLSPYRIAPGEPVRLADRPTEVDGGKTEDELDDLHDANLEALDELQERLFAEGTQSLLVVLQAMDAGGKDSTIGKVFGPLNPQGIRVWSFKKPTEKELSHDFLWRVHRRAPGHGYIGVFNRSHYEDVLVVKVHGLAPPDVIERRYDHIRHFEQILEDGGTTVVKFMLHISKDYQAERLRRRLRRPDKHWKFTPADLDERERWDDYMRCFETALERTSTESAPWYVVPAENRDFRDALVSSIVRETLERMDPQFPAPAFDPAEYPPESIE